MGRIEETFIKAKAQNQAVLIPYITVGYPTLEKSYELAIVLQQAGAGIIELGIPFSDPLADGPIIQHASAESLKLGTSLSDGIELVKRLRKDFLEIPLVFMTYYNPIYRYGVRRFVDNAQSAGIDGVIIPDLPPEEAGILKEYADNKGFCTIFLLAPTSTPSRIRLICKYSTGFIYYVSVIGITGIRDKLSSTLKTHMAEVSLVTTKPIAVGFGISTPKHVSEIASVADGVVVGSALIDLINRDKDTGDLNKSVGEFIASLAAGVKR